ncbi:hypothetical protein DH2020_038937 [Rehmannia glutinosa]|uniref:SBP-type domain-containing protein n=1 Tax=Rehmannia glutinosa TaxID=99300 RepID=A0ABR0UXV0_REHGL
MGSEYSRMEKGSSSSSSSGGCGGGGADPLNGLKFGKKIYFEGVGSGLRPKTGDGPAPPSPAKKGRTGVVQGGQPPVCQVEGCKVDLSDAKAYYCRHKVCGMHSKSPRVIVAGLEQRFCQQCSRRRRRRVRDLQRLREIRQDLREKKLINCIHRRRWYSGRWPEKIISRPYEVSLSPGFINCLNLTKESGVAVRRLAGHNERRRKPPPGPLLSSRYGNLSPSAFDNHSKTGGFVMDFSGYSTVAGRDPWPNTTSERGLGNQATTITGKYELSWPNSSQQNPLPDLLHGSTTRPGYSRPEISSEGCFNDSNGALSLLSNQSWGSRTQPPLSLGVNNFLGPHGSGLVQPSVDPGASIGQYPPWGFKGNQASNSLHEMAPDMVDLSAISHPSNGQFSGDLGLAQPSDGQYHDEIEPSRGYDSPVHHMHWSL